MAEETKQKQAPDTGGPAYPTTRNRDHAQEWETEEGISARDYFAAKAMHGILAGSTLVDLRADPKLGGSRYTLKFDKVAENAYKIADAMLKARNV